MSDENVERVRRSIEAFNAGDIERSIADVAAEFEYAPSGSIPGGEEAYRGPEGWKRFLELFWGESMSRVLRSATWSRLAST